jgi:hypothetical protein
MVCGAPGYSVLTHEAVIDSAWKDSIVPTLLKRFPNATPDDLRKAHAYVYGGAIIQDMGYYPFDSKFFSDLTHYVRSGDFVRNLLSEAADLNEYAFALGSLAHYVADNNGHPIAVNRVVPMMYPKLEKKFGTVVTYEDDPAAHLRVEFSFDVVEVAQGHFAPEAYHDFIGFEVSKPVLERAFTKTYSLDFPSLFFSEDLAFGTYRHSVASVLPTMTKAAWNLKKDEIRKAQPSMTKRKYIYNMSRASYRKEWGNMYKRPGFFARLLSFLFRLIPKVGPLRAFAFEPTPPAGQTLFMRSFNDTLTRYRRLLEQARQETLRLPDRNFDTGETTKAGVYRRADDAYAQLVDRLKDKPVTPELRANILSYYSDPQAPPTTKRNRKKWRKLLAELAALKGNGVPAQAAETGASH